METAASNEHKTGMWGVVSTRDRLATLYTTHGASARRLAFLLTGDRHTAEDLVQDAFVRLFRRYGDLRSDGDIAAYLRKTVVNLSIDHGRKRKRESDYRFRTAGAPAPTADPAEAPDDELWQALEEIGPRARVALVLRYYEDLSEQQTAEAMGCAVGTVKSYTSRGLQQLRDRLESDDA